MIGRDIDKYLGFVFQPTKGTTVQYAIAVALEFQAVRVWWFRVPASMTGSCPRGVRGLLFAFRPR